MSSLLSSSLASMSSVWLVLVVSVLVLPLLLLLCLKIKSSKKDPAFAGTEGKLITNHDDNNNGSNNNNGVAPSLLSTTARTKASTMTPTAMAVTASGARTDRKLPDLPASNEEPEEDQNYASVHVDSEDEDDDNEDEDNDDDDGAVGYASPSVLRSEFKASTMQRSNSSEMLMNHPYAKVTKNKEHPYATVKNKRNRQDDSQEQGLPQPPFNVRQQQVGGGRDEQQAQYQHPDLQSLYQRQHDRQEVEAERSHQDEPVQVDRGELAGAGGDGPPQQPQYFSGDSQDSSRTGYTHITVREPMAQLNLPPPPPPVNQNSSNSNNNYVAISETSDGLYAAIEDNDDSEKYNTEDKRGGNCNEENHDDGRKEDDPGENLSDVRDYESGNENGRVASVNQSETDEVDGARARSVRSEAPPMARNKETTPVEAMYAKVQKSSKLPSTTMVMADDDELPVGASAMRPMTLYSNLKKKQKAPLAEEERGDDYESVLPVANDGYERVHSNSGYETVVHANTTNTYEMIDGNALEPPYAQILKEGDEEDEEYDLNYETIPNSSARLSSDPGYERVHQASNVDVDLGFQVSQQRRRQREQQYRRHQQQEQQQLQQHVAGLGVEQGLEEAQEKRNDCGDDQEQFFV